MTFQLDMVGQVPTVAGSDTALNFYTWGRLDAFTQGYVEAMFAAGVWGQRCEPCAGNGEIVTDWDRYLGAPEPGDQGDEGTADCPTCDGQGSRSVGFSDLAPETLARIIADCEARFTGWVQHPNNAAVRSDDATEGARFWRDRQSGAATSFPRLTVLLGDDGKVRFAEPV